jgi:hypothetical protein
MPQNKHCRWLFLPLIINSVSLPVDVMMPFDVVATIGGDVCWLDDSLLLLLLFDAERLLRWLLLLLLLWFGLLFLLVLSPLDTVVFDMQAAAALALLRTRAARLLARADILRLRSSRSRDFSGET